MANPKQMFKDISDAIGSADPTGDTPDTELTVSQYERKDIVVAQEGVGEIKDADVSDDYDFGRKTLQTIAESGQEALQHALEVAVATGNSEAFATVSLLMKETADTVEKLLRLQEIIKKVKLADIAITQKSKSPDAPQGVPGHVTNILVGSTQDLLKLMREARKGEAIDAEFKEVGHDD